MNAPLSDRSVRQLALFRILFETGAGFRRLGDVYYRGREESDIHDDDWIESVVRGGPEQYRPFVQAFGPYIYKIAYSVLHSAHDAEDVTQEALLQIYRALPTYRNEGLKAWIARIAVNRSIDYKRSRARKPELLGEHIAQRRGEESESRASSAISSVLAPAAETVALKRERKWLIQQKIGELPDNYRDVVTAFYIEEKSCEQIASETGLARKSVESKLYRARDWMRRHWRKEEFE